MENIKYKMSILTLILMIFPFLKKKCYLISVYLRGSWHEVTDEVLALGNYLIKFLILWLNTTDAVLFHPAERHTGRFLQRY